MASLFETLKKSFYSERESNFELKQGKNFSQDTPEELIQQDGTIAADASESYSLGKSIDAILAEKSNLINNWRDMAYSPEVQDAIDEILNEAFVTDETGDRPFEMNLDDMEMPDSIKKKIEESYEKLFNLLDFDEKGEQLFKQWYIDGMLAMETVYNNNQLKNGIRALKILPPKGFYTIKDPKTKKTRHFLDTRQEQQNGQRVSLLTMYNDSNIQYIPEQICYIDSGEYSKDRLFPISHLHYASKVNNNLAMIEESMLIYRFTRSPQRNAIYVDTGRLPKAKAEQYIKNLMSKHRNKTTYNIGTGTVDNRKRSISMQEDIWFAVNAEGRGTKIESLQTASVDVTEIADLDYFYRKLWRSLKVPVQRRDPESRGNTINFQNQEIENEEIKFYKFVLKLRKRFMGIFRDLLKKELLITKVVSLEDWELIKGSIKFIFKNNNDFAKNKKLQTITAMMEVVQVATQIKADGGPMTNKFIETEIMGLTDEERADLKKEKEKDLAEMPKEDELE